VHVETAIKKSLRKEGGHCAYAREGKIFSVISDWLIPSLHQLYGLIAVTQMRWQIENTLGQIENTLGQIENTLGQIESSRTYYSINRNL
jgi:hypothetical protein